MADFLDRARGLARDLTGKARSTVNDNSDKLDGGIDKAAGFVDDKTRGKYSDKIERAQGAAHKAVHRIGGDEDGTDDEGHGSPGGKT